MAMLKILWLLLIGAVCCGAEASFRGYVREGQLLDIMLPRLLFQEFRYVPTREGYRFSYKLPDGTTYEEIGFIPNADASNSDSMTTTADRSGFKPRMNVKNRKLSPKSLQSLAG